MNFPTIFITVGTTEFDTLIKIIDSRGQYIPVIHLPTLYIDNNIEFEYYKFKSTLYDDMNQADLIISHCGAGTILEALDMKKSLIVVINDTLQGNHQSELSDALTEKNYLYSTTPYELINLMNELILTGTGFKELSVYPPTDYDLFPNFLDSLYESKND